jgi:type II secretory pathway component PulJ
VAVVIAIALIAIILVVAWYQRPSARTRRRVRRLEERYFRKVHMPRHLARESLHRHLARLRERHPGRGPAWYVAQAVAELDRDRR